MAICGVHVADYVALSDEARRMAVKFAKLPKLRGVLNGPVSLTRQASTLPRSKKPRLQMVERPPGSRALVGISAFGGLENGPQSSSHPVASTCNIAPFPCRRIVNLKNWLKAVRKKGTMSHETAIFQQVNADKVAAHHTAVSCLVRSVRASPWLPVRGVAGGRRRARPWCRDAGR